MAIEKKEEKKAHNKNNIRSGAFMIDLNLGV